LLAVLPLEYPLPRQADERFVDQRRALQGVVATFTRHLPARQPPHVVVDQRPQVFQRRGVAPGPALQQPRDLAGGLFVVVIAVVLDVHASLWRESQPRQ
jgi:hypothetical protein